MSTLINKVPQPSTPIVVDFGWYYGLTPLRLREISYQEEAITFPPGQTILGGSSTIILPSATVPTGFTTLAQLQATFEASGTIVINDYIINRATMRYTSLGVPNSGPYNGIPSFLGVTGGTGTYTVGTPIYDPHFYVDQMPLGIPITFDTIDAHNLGLSTTTVPQGTTILDYHWEFGNGQTGNGPYASTFYVYNRPPPSIQASLTVLDSRGKLSSCAHRLNLQALGIVWGTSLRERASNIGYR